MRTHCILVVYIALSLFLYISCQSLHHGPHETAANSDVRINVDMEKLSVVQPESSPKEFNDVISALIWRDNQCMLHQTAFDSSAKVFDFFTGEEIEVGKALYIISADVNTTQNKAIIAFKDQPGTEQFISRYGEARVYNFDELLEVDLSRFSFNP